MSKKSFPRTDNLEFSIGALPPGPYTTPGGKVHDACSAGYRAFDGVPFTHITDHDLNQRGAFQRAIQPGLISAKYPHMLATVHKLVYNSSSNETSGSGNKCSHSHLASAHL